MVNADRVDFTQSLPVKYVSDIVVVGGGMAGVCAACAAAKIGSRVTLIERFAILGGIATTGGVNGFCGETLGAGEIFDEILIQLVQFNSIHPYSDLNDFAFRSRRFNHEILPFILQEIVLKYHVHVLFHTRVVTTMQDSQKRITHVIIAGASGLEAIPVKMVIDCSGDGQVASLAHCDTFKGDEKRGLQLPMSYIGFVRSQPWFTPNLNIPPDYFPGPKYEQKSDLPMVSVTHCMSGDLSMKIKVPGFDATDTVSMSNAEVECRRKFMRVLAYYKSHGKRWTVSHESPIIGIREGKRIAGLYILTVDDVRAGRNFFDAVAVGTYSLDAHKPDDDKRTYILPLNQLNIPPYHIPLRSLIAKDCPNLLMAGRNLSADQLAMSSARVMPTCAQMGHATGIVAAICIQNTVIPSHFVEREEIFLPIAKLLKEARLNLDLDSYLEKKKHFKFGLPINSSWIFPSPDQKLTNQTIKDEKKNI